MFHPRRTSIMQPMGWQHNCEIRKVRKFGISHTKKRKHFSKIRIFRIFKESSLKNLSTKSQWFWTQGKRRGYLTYLSKGKNIIDFKLPREFLISSRPRARRLVLCDIQLCLTWLWWVSESHREEDKRVVGRAIT